MLILTILLAALSAVPGIEIYQYSPDIQKSSRFLVSAEGQQVRVLPTEQAHIAMFGAEEEAEVSIIYLGGELRYADIRPLDKGYEYEIEGNTLKVKLKTYDRVSIEMNGDKEHPLFVFVNPLEKDKAKSLEGKNGVLVFKAGGIYQEKRIDLKNYSEVYIEGGAFVQAVLLGVDLAGIKIHGCGILDSRAEKGNSLKLTECNNVQMENICLLNKGMAACQFVNCTDVSINNIKAVNIKTTSASSEKAAFDLAGGKKIRAERIFAYSQSHAISIHNKYGETSYTAEEFNFNDCVAWNEQTGSAIHIVGSNAGITNVRFNDFYAVHSAGMPKPYYRSVINVKQSESKKISNLEFNNCFAENPGEYIFCLKGWISDVRFNGFKVYSKAPYGSLLNGTDFYHRVENVRFENFTIAKKQVKNLKQAGVKNPTMGLNVIFL